MFLTIKHFYYAARGVIIAVPILAWLPLTAFAAWFAAPAIAAVTGLDVVPREPVAAATTGQSNARVPPGPPLQVAPVYRPPIPSEPNNGGAIGGGRFFGGNNSAGAGQASRPSLDLQTAPGSGRGDLAQREEGQRREMTGERPSGPEREAPRAFGGNQMPERWQPGGFGRGFLGGGWRPGGFGGGFGRAWGMMGGGRRR
jgi:hypothetical protein